MSNSKLKIILKKHIFFWNMSLLSTRCKWAIMTVLLVLLFTNLMFYKIIFLEWQGSHKFSIALWSGGSHYDRWESKDVFQPCEIKDSNNVKVLKRAEFNFSESDSSDIFEEMKNIEPSVSNVFFVETTCAARMVYETYYKKRISFIMGPRQWCAVESMALTNPNRRVYILNTCPMDEDVTEKVPDYVRGVFYLPNVRIVRLNVSEMFRGTPIQMVYESGVIETSPYFLEHFSDLIRVAALWRFGGTYCDLDFIIMKCLNDLGTDFAASQDTGIINSAIFNINPEGFGHKLMYTMMELLKYMYRPDYWDWNGPSLLTNTILYFCQVEKVEEVIETCEKFKVYKRHIFYPVHYGFVEELFNHRTGKIIVEFAENISYGVHMWNKLNNNMKVQVGSTQAYSILAERYCPHVYWNSGEVF
ncbi:lactosylceramide 4-alpha-galactosyltransferase-like [Homalodisca vitripennis]|uniref:lactosylceramide 4-alpha-galactosyltransferase-like n=1 Tax=Homalodisca vitripennis TaxID=197043 RepID=UPI001EECEFA0|nr:lactosylceramide 4-alpha-galactosyltransferase-like [Homalodisca vitripennis]